MRESCTYGSVRGTRGNSRSYRDPSASNATVTPVTHKGLRLKVCCQARALVTLMNWLRLLLAGLLATARVGLARRHDTPVFYS